MPCINYFLLYKTAVFYFSGGFLSSVNSGYEQAFIYLTMKQYNVDAVWIGLNDVKVNHAKFCLWKIVLFFDKSYVR